MLYLLAQWLEFEGLFNLVRYQTFRSGATLLTALTIGLVIGPKFIAMLRVRQGKGQPIRSDGPQSHLAKVGTPTMGGLMILTSLLIDESYNANPASMRATLAQLGQTPASRRIAVLGSMKELGDFAPAFHAQLAEPLSEAEVDFAVLVGPEMAALARELGKAAHNPLGKPLAFAHCGGPGEAIAALEEFGLVGGDAVLVKGSNSVGLARLVSHFAAREG